ncbi:hypothetical protein N5C46_10740 [Rossellomorea vietnamensis]|uniref:Uncharacterized protein n=1 Tax=Rossellomorea vietnamensis TaxID=218284 RepID=A0ACD4CCZ4_9BACI|nr:hypothetical protein [Rossellomorea vietnamensis]UXH46491.1 hypothetical protein N5C46_10740 [Rossellomorea vietnamensis]
MKIMGITLLMMGCLMGFSLGLDILQGFDVSDAWQNAVSPFRVMEVAELFVLFILLFLFFGETAYEVIKKRKKGSTKP